MTAAKRKGTAWETLVTRALNLYGLGTGLYAYRPAQAGFRDEGDIHGLSPFVAQCKDYASLADALREGLDGAVKQAEHAGEDYGVAIVKRRRRSVGDAYAVMRLEDFARVLLRLRDAEYRLGITPSAAAEYHAAEVVRLLGEGFPTAADIDRARKDA